VVLIIGMCVGVNVRAVMTCSSSDAPAPLHDPNGPAKTHAKAPHEPLLKAVRCPDGEVVLNSFLPHDFDTFKLKNHIFPNVKSLLFFDGFIDLASKISSKMVLKNPQLG
jgi:hypothetical protein